MSDKKAEIGTETKMEIRTDYSDIHFQNNGKLKLLIIVGTRPDII